MGKYSCWSSARENYEQEKNSNAQPGDEWGKNSFAKQTKTLIINYLIVLRIQLQQKKKGNTELTDLVMS